jgi:hypothetical protein
LSEFYRVTTLPKDTEHCYTVITNVVWNWVTNILGARSIAIPDCRSYCAWFHVFFFFFSSGFGPCCGFPKGRLPVFATGRFVSLFTQALWDAHKHSVHEWLSATDLVTSKPACVANSCSTAVRWTPVRTRMSVRHCVPMRKRVAICATADSGARWRR